MEEHRISLHLVSDATGETLNSIARATVAQFEHANVVYHRWNLIRTRLRKSLSSKVWCVSATPSSQGKPACFSDDSGEAPGPPSWPEMRMTSARALATPAGVVPTPPG